MESVPHVLAGWESFYVIVGSSAAALTGLQFVVIALVADTIRRASATQFGAFATPTVVHFSSVLLTSSVLSAPWPTLRGVSIFLMSAGLAGVCYSIVVTLRARRQGAYAMVLEDWIFHVVLPLIAYGALIVAGILMQTRPATALFATAGIQLMILFIGIHNAWDTATYIALEHISTRQNEPGEMH